MFVIRERLYAHPVLLSVYFPFLTNECHPSVANGRTMIDLLVAGILQVNH
jgi:hypothetical protein